MSGLGWIINKSGLEWTLTAQDTSVCGHIYNSAQVILGIYNDINCLSSWPLSN